MCGWARFSSCRWDVYFIFDITHPLICSSLSCYASSAAQPELLHGECVSIGMLLECEAASYMSVCDPYVTQRLQRCLSEFGLPVRLPPRLLSADASESLIAHMRMDKKNTSSAGADPPLHCVLLSAVGVVAGPRFTHAVDAAIMRMVLSPSVTVADPHSPRVSAVSTVHKIRVPGSKSLSNRVLVLAALAMRPVAVTGFLQSDDTEVRRFAYSLYHSVFTGMVFRASCVRLCWCQY